MIHVIVDSPQLISKYPARWRDPLIRGKRVGLDGTLITNRFFFARLVGELESKKVVIGWHSLIQKMRKGGVIPIVVYDQPGLRQWKIKEQARRESNRSLSLSRSLHEDRRQNRLYRLEELTKQYEVAAVELEGATPAEEVRAELVEALTRLQQEVASEKRPQLRKSVKSKEDAALDVATGEEVPVCGRDIDFIPPEEAEAIPIEPRPEYTETPRQSLLTEAEASLIQQALESVRVQLPSDVLRLEIQKLAEQAKNVAATYDSSLGTPGPSDHQETKDLLRIMGVPVIDVAAPYEAEGVASAMALKGLIDFVGTEDSDVLGYEAPLLRNAATSSQPLSLVDGTQLREALNLEKAEFLDFILLCGTDATSRIYRHGVKRALKLIHAHNSIEAALASKPQLQTLAGEGFMDDIRLGRKVFGHLPPIPEEAFNLTIEEVNDKVVRDFLEREHGLMIDGIREDATPERMSDHSNVNVEDIEFEYDNLTLSEEDIDALIKTERQDSSDA